MDADIRFFLPRPWLRVDERVVLRDEVFCDDGGESRVGEFVYRAGDELVYVKGTIRHPGREAVRLGHWHRIITNSEANAPATGHGRAGMQSGKCGGL